MLKDAFEEINLPLYLVPYSVIPNRTGPDHAQGGILQVLIIFPLARTELINCYSGCG